MNNLIDKLLFAFETVLKQPWATNLSGKEKVWFLVYDPSEQRKVDFRYNDFLTIIAKANKKAVEISLKKVFAVWMATHEYKEEYFNDPDCLQDQLELNFKDYTVNFCLEELNKQGSDNNTVIILKDVSALYGFVRLSLVIDGLSNYINGRMLVFFPGEYEKNQYRLLGARDGWNYLARPILA